MSGGRFNYEQFRITHVVDEIEKIAAGKTFLEGFGDVKSIEIEEYTAATKAKFKEAVVALKRAEAMATRIDWLLSGDDDEGDFHERWAEELAKIEEAK